MLGYWVLMCFHMTTLHWGPPSGVVHTTKTLCVYELLDRAQYRSCRCEPYIIVFHLDDLRRGD